MIDQKYLELINRDIDDVISPDEKKLLKDYLGSNPEAYTMHQELIEVEKLLDKLPDNEPSDALKQRILNSIDINRYSHKKKRSMKEYFSVLFSGHQRKLTISFALGLVAGIILLSVIFYASFYNNFSEVNHVLGTIGLSESQVVESVDVSSADITGKIDIIKGVDQYAVYVNLKSTAKFTLQVEFDKEYLKVVNFAETDITNNSPYSLSFSAKDVSPHKLFLTILREDSKLFERKISLTNR